jgi:hypothetical protein
MTASKDDTSDIRGIVCVAWGNCLEMGREHLIPV